MNFLNFVDNDFTEFASSVNNMLRGNKQERKYSFFGKDPFTWAAGPTLGLFLDGLISFGMADNFRKRRFKWDALAVCPYKRYSRGKLVASTAFGSRDFRRIAEYALEPEDLPKSWRHRKRSRSLQSLVFGTFGFYRFNFDKKKRPWGGTTRKRKRKSPRPRF